jgi:hypothetical protein
MPAIGSGTETISASKPAVEPVRSAASARMRTVPRPAVWQVYTALAIAVSAFLLAVLLMAAGVVGPPQT